jgi:AraC-like DNA-binding protein/quercetin dioxygenase-like cupin family protein
MKPLLEKHFIPEGASWTLTHRILHDGIPFEWHYHAEYELTLTLNSSGQRFIGNHVATYADGDLVLVGPNIPHTWKSNNRYDDTHPHEVVVLWFKNDWILGLIEILPELSAMRTLLRASERGVLFGTKTAEQIRSVMLELPSLNPPERLPVFLNILILISKDMTVSTLSSGISTDGERNLSLDKPTHNQLERVLEYLHAHYADAITVAHLSNLACLSPSALSRTFRRSTRMSLMQYVTRLRIGRACSLLIEGTMSIAQIADVVGYYNLSNFNKHFLAEKRLSPRAFQKRFRSAL